MKFFFEPACSADRH